MKLFSIVLGLLMSFNAYADIPTELKCQNIDGETLKWNFTILSLPVSGHPGIIQGEINELRLLNSIGTYTDYTDEVSNPLAIHYTHVLDYANIHFNLPGTGGVDSLNIFLEGELLEALGNPSTANSLPLDSAVVSLSISLGNDHDVVMICSLRQ